MFTGRTAVDVLEGQWLEHDIFAYQNCTQSLKIAIISLPVITGQ